MKPGKKFDNFVRGKALGEKNPGGDYKRCEMKLQRQRQQGPKKEATQALQIGREESQKDKYEEGYRTNRNTQSSESEVRL